MLEWVPLEDVEHHFFELLYPHREVSPTKYRTETRKTTIFYTFFASAERREGKIHFPSFIKDYNHYTIKYTRKELAAAGYLSVRVLWKSWRRMHPDITFNHDWFEKCLKQAKDLETIQYGRDKLTQTYVQFGSFLSWLQRTYVPIPDGYFPNDAEYIWKKFKIKKENLNYVNTYVDEKGRQRKKHKVYYHVPFKELPMYRISCQTKELVREYYRRRTERELRERERRNQSRTRKKSNKRTQRKTNQS